MKFQRFDLTSITGINRIGKVCAMEFRRPLSKLALQFARTISRRVKLRLIIHS